MPHWSVFVKELVLFISIPHLTLAPSRIPSISATSLSYKHQCDLRTIGPSLLSEMRATLRRSCDACAKAKHGCDLRTPRCSRCIKRKTNCVYTNEPLTSSPETSGNSTLAVRDNEKVSSLTLRERRSAPAHSESSAWVLNTTDASFDPFDSYPPTRLPRVHVQRLIYHCNCSYSINKNLGI